MGRPTRCCGGDCEKPVVTCALINNIIYYTIDNANTASFRRTQRNSQNYFYGTITLDENGHAEGQFNVADIALIGNFPPFNSGYYEVLITANNDCGSDSCQIKCGVVINSSISRRHPNCYVPVPCSTYNIPPTQTCFGDGPYILQWSVRIYNNGYPIQNITITINGNVVTPSSYDAATNTYSGEIQVDRCDLLEIYTIEANIEACGTEIIHTSTYSVPCIDRKNSFIIELSLNDYITTFTLTQASIGYYHSTVTEVVGSSIYNGTHIFPIECYPIFNSFTNRYEFIRRVIPNFIELNGSYTVTTISNTTSSSFPFIDGFTSVDVYRARVNPVAPCSPLGRTRQSLTFTRIGQPPQYYECPGAGSPYCGGVFNCFYFTRLLGSDVLLNCINTNECGNLGVTCEMGIKEYELLTSGNQNRDLDNPSNDFTDLLVVGTMKVYYDCL